MINKPHIRDVLAKGGAPGRPASLDEHHMAGLSVAMGFVPDDELGSNDLRLWRRCEFPGTNAHVSALGLATFTTGWPRRRSCPAVTSIRCGFRRAVSILT